MKKTWVANIVKDKEDGQVLLSYSDMDKDNYDYLDLDEFIEEVENANTWDFIDSEVYDMAFEGVGLDFSSYDDPDEACDDFLKTSKDYE